MCAIVDANVASDVFGKEHKKRSPAGKGFYDWLKKGQSRMVTGRKLMGELRKVSNFERWAEEAKRGGILRDIKEADIEVGIDFVRKKNIHKSDDCHILGLAIASGARLLYSNDKALQKDFTNTDLIPKGLPKGVPKSLPRGLSKGKVYSTNHSRTEFYEDKKKLLENNRCPIWQG